MNILVAGATGAVGRTLIPLLTERGHAVTGTTTSPAKLASVRALGAEPVVMDGLDRDAVASAVRDAKPDAIVHQMTALGGITDLRKFERAFATTNRLRSEGTDHLLEAAREHGIEAFVNAGSSSEYGFKDHAPREDEPLEPNSHYAVAKAAASMCAGTPRAPMTSTP